MSINRTRWLDKLRPAGASSGGWTEGPMAPVETTDAVTVDQRCPSNIGQGGDTIIQTQNCVSPCAWVKLIFSLTTNCHLCAGTMLTHVEEYRWSNTCFFGWSNCCCFSFLEAQPSNTSLFSSHKSPWARTQIASFLKEHRLGVQHCLKGNRQTWGCLDLKKLGWQPCRPSKRSLTRCTPVSN